MAATAHQTLLYAVIHYLERGQTHPGAIWDAIVDEVDPEWLLEELLLYGPEMVRRAVAEYRWGGRTRERLVAYDRWLHRN